MVLKINVSAALWAAVLTTSTCVITGCSRSPASVSEGDAIAHGRYLVHQVSMCIDCHSPRNERGQFLEQNHLMGAALGFAPTMPMPWAPAAPGIAGLPAGYTETDMVTFMMTGARPNGQPPAAPPMPEYRMNRSDAEAVTAYLRSLRLEVP